MKKLLVLYPPFTTIEIEVLVPKIVQALSKNANKPKCGVDCSAIDALVHVSLKNQYLAAHSDIPNLDD